MMNIFKSLFGTKTETRTEIQTEDKLYNYFVLFGFINYNKESEFEHKMNMKLVDYIDLEEIPFDDATDAYDLNLGYFTLLRESSTDNLPSTHLRVV